jgi:hypothetical protein
MQQTLVALALAIWTQVSALYARQPDAQRIAEASAQVVLEDAARALPPFGSSYAEDLVVQDYWALRESGLRARAVGDGGKAHGAWQEHSACGVRPLPEQARCWRELVREGVRRCGPGPAAYAILWGGCAVDLTPYGAPGATSATAAAKRVSAARALLRRALENL